jgi:subtilisin family serine protease
MGFGPNGPRRRIVAAAAAAITVGGVATAITSATGASAAAPKLAAGVHSGKHSLDGMKSAVHATPRGEANAKSALPAGVPTHGNYAFLLKLGTQTTGAAFRAAQAHGSTASAKSAARSQLATVKAAQNKVISALPANSDVLYRMHAVLSAVAVRTNVKNYQALTHLAGVSAVYPIAPKSLNNATAIPLQRAPQAWQATGDLGANSTVAIIDTGVDYTHADFGGVGTVAEYDAAKAQLGKPVSPNEFPGPKVIGGFDLVGDDYDANPQDDTFQPVPHPDAFPLDCNSHGSHVAGTVAGFGENADGSTYTGPYDTTTPFSDLRIGPGMAPKAKLYAFRVFGCAGSTNVVAQAIDMAADPNGDGNTSDHADVINMSLGSDFGSPQDGDSVATNAAAALGINMAVASGNAGDLYDVGGSPGNASRSIAVAASVDSGSVVDSLNVGAPINQKFAAERSVAYPWDTPGHPDLAGDVARVTDPTNLDGCDPLSDADKAAVAGKIAFVEWTDVDANRRCGSAVRGGHLADAGATGFIFADDEDHFAAGITGDPTIPGVLVSKTGGDAIRAALANGPVTITGTTKNGFAQSFPELNDTLASFSSRGINDVDNVKPDVTAVGDSVFSAGNGTGNEGLNDSGTSMATPMVAGTAALVHSLHPDWNTEQVKADIMNTADADLFTGPNHTGSKFAPNRVGAGRINAETATSNDTLAYVVNSDTATTGDGRVSASFGPIAVTPSADPTVLTKVIRVQNTGLAAHTYDVSFDPRTSIPGATYSVAPSSITVDPRSAGTLTLTLTLNPSQLTKTIDPTVARSQGGLPREFQADASGLVTFTGHNGEPQLRVPAYAAPRPASDMSQASSLSFSGKGKVQESLLKLTGDQVNQGAGAAAVQSLVSGFELQAKSGLAPTCTSTLTDGCVSFPDERSADLKYVGATSSAPQNQLLGQDPLSAGLAYFSITTQGPWRTAGSTQEFDIYIDSTGDGVADAVLFNTRLTASDTMVDELIDLNPPPDTSPVLDVELINDRFGDTDTALFNSDTLVMPVAIGALPGVSADASRISYSVLGFSNEAGAPIDTVGDVANDNTLINPLSMDVLNPGVAVFGSVDDGTSPLLFRDTPGSVVEVRRDLNSYQADKGLGALIVHFHNVVGDKAQVVSLAKRTPSVSLTMKPGKVKRLSDVTVTMTVTGAAGAAPTGTVNLRRLNGAGAGIVRTATLKNGTVTITYHPGTVGNVRYRAEYTGSAAYAAANSPKVTLVVTK